MPRRPLDFYETPPHYIEALQRVIGVPSGRLIEPCVGKGAIVEQLTVEGQWTTNDLNPRLPWAAHHLDATRQRLWRGRFDWAITNPPFSQELPILRHALRYCDNVAMLARLSFLEPTIERRLFWSRWQRNVEVIVLPRYSFKKVRGARATDTMTCCWLVWRHNGAAFDHRQFFVSLGREPRKA